MRKDVLNTIPNWVEDFEGKTTVDETIFTADGKPTTNYTGETYVNFDWGVIKSSQARVEGSQLILSMDKRKTPKVFKGDKQQKERWWDTAKLRTLGKVEFERGAVEIVSKGGCYPAFWFCHWARTVNPALDGEIDFREVFGLPGAGAADGALKEYEAGLLVNRFKTTVHFNYENKINVGKVSPLTPANCANDFHTYGFLKDDEQIIFYFEREEVFRVTRAENPARWDAAFPKGEKLYLLECTQAGSAYYGKPTEETPDHCEYVVDRVTVWDFDNPVSGQGEYSSLPVFGSSSS